MGVREGGGRREMWELESFNSVFSQLLLSFTIWYLTLFPN